MLSDIVQPGQVVEMMSAQRTSENNTEEDISKVYRTKVFDILTEDQLEVIMPMEKSKLILLPIDGEFDLCFYTDNGLYQCFCRVIDRYKSNNVYILVMELTSNLRKYQRREYYRFSCALEMKSRVLEPEEVKAVDRKELYLVPGLPVKRSVIVDISGGGLRFIANYQYELDSMIFCNYKLLVHGESRDYQLVGKVLSVSELENRPGIYEHRVQYVNVDIDVREEIIRYIFEEERKQRHKEGRL
ncbi:MAG: flagellar brake domain-containing protein [Lachnospiraceae bacterium]|nr:flagellar brake domain-containing protein [Lachnospiraceae bacterium]